MFCLQTLSTYRPTDPFLCSLPPAFWSWKVPPWFNNRSLSVFVFRMRVCFLPIPCSDGNYLLSPPSHPLTYNSPTTQSIRSTKHVHLFLYQLWQLCWSPPYPPSSLPELTKCPNWLSYFLSFQIIDLLAHMSQWSFKNIEYIIATSLHHIHTLLRILNLPIFPAPHGIKCKFFSLVYKTLPLGSLQAFRAEQYSPPPPAPLTPDSRHAGPSGHLTTLLSSLLSWAHYSAHPLLSPLHWLLLCLGPYSYFCIIVTVMGYFPGFFSVLLLSVSPLWFFFPFLLFH